MSNLTKVKLHGYLGEQFGEDWELSIQSVAESIRAIDANSNGNFYKALAKNDKSGIKYKVIINGKKFEHETYEKTGNLDDLRDSELVINKRIETIDIVPCIEGAFWGLILGGLSLIGLGNYFDSSMIMMIGLGLVLQGASNLMATPPKFEEFAEIQQINKRQSYLFSGPLNTVSEGGPVPLGYGRLIIGSQLIGQDLKIVDKAYPHPYIP